ncbi:hypothetical protein [Mesorhizobium cantuariense]|uniref:Uncharacterized protein n=1 Tax=Mesorhizobium cantuariense TaxID=1300275 RepID=A0ABV7MU45_9HYPH
MKNSDDGKKIDRCNYLKNPDMAQWLSKKCLNSRWVDFPGTCILFVPRKDKTMVSVRTPRGMTVAINPIIKPTNIHAVAAGPTAKPMVVKSARLTIRSDEAARRTLADTDGTVRRARQVAETNRLI